MLDNLVCPVSNVRIDGNVVRLTGLFSTLLLVAYVLTGAPWIIVPLALDYAVRTMLAGPPSPMARLARLTAQALGLPFRAMDKAPKVFAARIGVCFAMGAAVAHFVAPGAASWIAGTLAVFAGLESIFDFCVGCVVYSYVALPLFRARQAVKSIALFRDVDDLTLAAIASGFERVAFPAGARIVEEGEEGHELFVLADGDVEVIRRTPDGSEAVIATRRRGSSFGEMSLLSGMPRNATVRALTPVTVLRLEKSRLDLVLQRHPEMRDVLMKTSAARAAEDRAAAAAA